MGFRRDWFTNELVETKDGMGGRQIIARESIKTGYDPSRSGRHRGAYDRGWSMEAFGVPIEQINDFNDAARRQAPGVTYVPSKDGGYAIPIGESRRSRNALLKMKRKIDFDGGYGDRTGS